MIYSASLTYNPLDIKTISLNETFQRSKNEQNQENGTASETNSHELNTSDNLTSSGTSKTSGNSNSSSYNTASSLNVASDTPQRTNFKTANFTRKLCFFYFSKWKWIWNSRFYKFYFK